MSSQLLEIQGLNFEGAYNPSIEKVGDRYLITFRIDNTGEGLIGYVYYNKNFNQVSQPILFDLKNALLPHDARLFYFDDTLCLLYSHTFFKNLNSLDKNNFPPWHLLTGMKQTLSHIDSKNKLSNSIELEYGTSFEKNWTPFEYKDEYGSNNLYFVYKFNPFEITPPY